MECNRFLPRYSPIAGDNQSSHYSENTKRSLTLLAISSLVGVAVLIAWSASSDYTQQQDQINPSTKLSQFRETQTQTQHYFNYENKIQELFNDEKQDAHVQEQTQHDFLKEEDPKSVKGNLPNVIFMMIDDMGYADMPYTAEKDSLVKDFMPHVVNFVEESVRFEYYYAEHLCTPARATLLTGKHPIHSGMQYKVCDEPNPFGLPLAHKIMPEYFQDRGYHTYMLGKWHLGFFNKQFLPTERGFDTFYGYYAGSETYYQKFIFEEDVAYLDFHLNNDVIRDETYSIELYENQASKIIHAHDKSKPMFMYYATQAIHAPYSDPPSYMLTEEQQQLATEVEEKSGSSRSLLLQTAAALDHSFGKLVDDLKRAGMYDDTWILVGSDNGGCSATGGNNFPLRGQKNTLFEGGVRTNGFIHSPLLPDFLKNSTYDCLFHKVDWLSTVINGILGDPEDLGGLDSINQWDSIIKLNKSCPRSDMIHNLEIDQTAGTDTLRVGVRSGKYKFVYGEQLDGWWNSTSFDPDEENCDVENNEFPPFGYIFDIENDESEHVNLIESIDDSLLDEFWSKVDNLYLGQTKPAYKEEDYRSLETWAHNGYSLVPWVEDQDLQKYADNL